MTAADIAANILSSLALLVSFATLYLTFLRRKAALAGCLASITAPELDSREEHLFEFALSNTGAVELLIRSVSLDVPEIHNNLIPEVNSTALPLVLKPGQIQLVALMVPSMWLRQIAKNKGNVIFSFHVFSSHGKSYLPTKLLALEDEGFANADDAWALFHLGKGS